MTQRKFDDGEIIYRAGDPSIAAYQVLDGAVELVRPGGGETSVMVRAGGMFGELGALDKSPRSSTARAAGPAVIEVIDRETFLNALEEDPATAQRVMTRLVARLRRDPSGVFSHPLDGPPPSESEPADGFLGGLRRLGRLLGLGMEAEETGTPEGLPALADARPMTGGILVLVAGLQNDADGVAAQAVLDSLSNRKAVVARTVGRALPLDPTTPLPPQLAQAESDGRAWLQEAKADLLIWGRVNGDGKTMTLHFLSARPDTRPGSFALADALTLPAEMESGVGDLFYAVTLAAAVPSTDTQKQRLGEALDEALRKAQRAGRRPPSSLAPAERAGLQACLGCTQAVAGNLEAGVQMLETAVETFNEALKTLPEDQNPIAWATINKHRADTLALIGERAQQDEKLEAAAEAYRQAAGIFSPTYFADDWGRIQMALGNTLYRLGMKDEDDTTRLKDAILAYQAALKVYTRRDAPHRWAEIHHIMGKTLQIVGSYLESPDLMKRAAAACRSAMEVRTRHARPTQWAATQGHLGTALVQLGRMTEDPAPVQEARDVFAATLEVWQAHGNQRMTNATQKNLEHAERVLRGLTPRLTGPPEPAEPDGTQDWWLVEDE